MVVYKQKFNFSVFLSVGISKLTNPATEYPLSPLIKEVKPTQFSAINNLNTSAIHNPVFIDFITNDIHKKLYMPTNTSNTLKVYQDLNINPILIEDKLNKIEILDPARPEETIKKEAIRMIQIRRRKMRKHKLKKLRKRMKFVFEKIKMKRYLRKEQAFRSELLTQVEAADKFDAKEYVEKILNTIRYQPKQRTIEEERERRRQLKKVNRYQTSFIKPRFDY